MKRLAAILALVQLMFPNATMRAQEAEEPADEIELAQTEPAPDSEPAPAPADDQSVTRPGFNRPARQGGAAGGNRNQRRQAQRSRQNPGPGGPSPTYSARGSERDRRPAAPAAKSQEAEAKAEPTDTAAGATNGGPANFRAFRMITEQNIFNATRTRRSGRPEPRERTEPAPTFTLVGIMDYQKGPYAFFDGSGSEFKKTLAPGGKIAGFTVAQITDSTVKLASGTNTVELTLGTQLRREDSEWKVVRGSGSSALTAFSKEEGKSESADDSEEEAAIVKRLMKQREEEVK